LERAINKHIGKKNADDSTSEKQHPACLSTSIPFEERRRSTTEVATVRGTMEGVKDEIIAKFSAAPAFDLEDLNGRIGCNMVLLERVAAIFDETGDKYDLPIKSVIEIGDFDTALDAAHSLKWAAAGLGGRRCSEVARCVETCGLEGDVRQHGKFNANVSGRSRCVEESPVHVFNWYSFRDVVA